MKYPTILEVNAASHEQICRWWRFLPPPGKTAMGTPGFSKSLNAEARVMERIARRLSDLGGFTPELSKKIGWEE